MRHPKQVLLLLGVLLVLVLVLHHNGRHLKPSEDSMPTERTLPKPRADVKYMPSGCFPQKRHFNCCHPVTALASVPGSGTHWLQYLLEEATGYYTGTIYAGGMGPRPRGFVNYVDGRSLAVKTHEPFFPQPILSNCTRAVVLVRSPYDALMSEFNRAAAGSLGHASAADVEKGWKTFFKGWVGKHRAFYKYWLSKNLPIHLVQYESLQTDLRHQLRDVVQFLGLEIAEEQLDCVCSHSEGTFHRPRRTEPFEIEFGHEMREESANVYNEVQKRYSEYAKETRHNTLQ